MDKAKFVRGTLTFNSDISRDVASWPAYGISGNISQSLYCSGRISKCYKNMGSFLLCQWSAIYNNMHILVRIHCNVGKSMVYVVSPMQSVLTY